MDLLVTAVMYGQLINKIGIRLDCYHRWLIMNRVNIGLELWIIFLCPFHMDFSLLAPYSDPNLHWTIQMHLDYRSS